jgi:CheY-like chemotaxis protein
MIVEDDDDIRESLTELLESGEFAPFAVKNGESALRELRAGYQPSVILLDLKMPGLNGWDFRREQRNDPRLSKIPVVIMTGLGIPDDGLRAEVGDVIWLPKPFTPDALRGALSAALRGS